MNLSNARIVCLGSTHFSSHVFQYLYKTQVNIIGFVTLPDKPAGRGLHLQSTPVKNLALSLNKPLLQPEKLNDAIFLNEIKNWKPDLLLVIAFRKLPPELLIIPTRGAMNLHMSLLPAYRGPAPIHWAIINGETTTGLTTFILNDIIDGGDVIDQMTIPIAIDDTHDSLEKKMMELAGPFIFTSMELYLSSKVSLKPQQISGLEPKAPKLTRENTRIQWNAPAEKIYNLIRGLYAKPSAWTVLHAPTAAKTWYCKIHASKIFLGTIKQQPPGSIEIFERKRLIVHTATVPLEILSLQLEGKKAMDANAFIRGFENHLMYAKFE